MRRRRALSATDASQAEVRSRVAADTRRVHALPILSPEFPRACTFLIAAPASAAGIRRAPLYSSRCFVTDVPGDADPYLARLSGKIA